MRCEGKWVEVKGKIVEEKIWKKKGEGGGEDWIEIENGEREKGGREKEERGEGEDMEENLVEKVGKGEKRMEELRIEEEEIGDGEFGNGVEKGFREVEGGFLEKRIGDRKGEERRKRIGLRSDVMKVKEEERLEE